MNNQWFGMDWKNEKYDEFSAFVGFPLIIFEWMHSESQSVGVRRKCLRGHFGVGAFHEPGEVDETKPATHSN
jgi:hypothetical protein